MILGILMDFHNLQEANPIFNVVASICLIFELRFSIFELLYIIYLTFNFEQIYIKMHTLIESFM